MDTPSSNLNSDDLDVDLARAWLGITDEEQVVGGKSALEKKNLHVLHSFIKRGVPQLCLCAKRFVIIASQ